MKISFIHEENMLAAASTRLIISAMADPGPVREKKVEELMNAFRVAATHRHDGWVLITEHTGRMEVTLHTESQVTSTDFATD